MHAAVALPARSQPNPSLAQPLFLDDFASPLIATPDGSKGYMTTFPFGGGQIRSMAVNHEVQCYTDPGGDPDPFAWEPGRLTITAAAGNNACSLAYTSGLLTTFTRFWFLYGYTEIRTALPAAPGSWPAFWLLPHDNQGESELDVFEAIGADAGHVRATRISRVLHIAEQAVVTVSPPVTSMHTYGVDWEPDAITWYLDGRKVATKPTPANMNTPMYLLTNLAISGPGSWQGPPTAATHWPLRMVVEHIGVYRTAGTRSAEGPAAIGQHP